MVRETSKPSSTDQPKNKKTSVKTNITKLVKKNPVQKGVKQPSVKSVKSSKSVKSVKLVNDDVSINKDGSTTVSDTVMISSDNALLSTTDTDVSMEVSNPAVSVVATPSRKVNNKPILAKTTGINISPSKVKNIVSNHVLNKDAHAALKEIRSAKQIVTKRMIDGKEVSEETKGSLLSTLSKQTLDYIAYAENVYDTIQKEEYAKSKIALMPEYLKKEYNLAKNAAKDAHDKQVPELYLNNASSTFDVELFNSQYMPNFYDNYVVTKNASDLSDNSDECKRAIEKITKLKNRFSTNSRVFLSAFVECIVKQLALNGTVCCVADNKKIIQLSHVLDTSVAGFKDRFPLYSLIVNLDTFKQAQAHLANPNTSKVVEEVSDDSLNEDSMTDEKVVDSGKKIKPDRDVDVFNLEGVSLETQYQFRYYIAETCRETRFDLSSAEVNSTGKSSSVYNYTSVSKLFKNFCSTLVCEFLMRIGEMLKKEIENRNIKTVNDNIVGTVISHYHIVSGVNETKTLDFIRNVANKYYGYVNDRHQKRKDNKNINVVGDVSSIPTQVE